jgi:hypothetical protein
MAYNLFIAYDLIEPGQNYDAVQQRIKELGSWYQFQYSLFYVHTELSPAEAAEHVLAVMDVRDYPGRNQGKDRLLVIDAKEGVTTTWDRPPIADINAIWHQP